MSVFITYSGSLSVPVIVVRR